MPLHLEFGKKIGPIHKCSSLKNETGKVLVARFISMHNFLVGIAHQKVEKFLCTYHNQISNEITRPTF